MSSDFDPTGDGPIGANRIRTPGIDDDASVRESLTSQVSSMHAPVGMWPA